MDGGPAEKGEVMGSDSYGRPGVQRADKEEKPDEVRIDRRRFLAISGAGLAVLSPLVAACGGEGSNTGAATSTSPAPPEPTEATTDAGATTAPEATTEAATTAEAEDQAVLGGRLRVGVVGGGNTETLNFGQTVNEIDATRALTLFEGLTNYDPDGKPYNQLAEEFSTNSDATVWTIKLRPDVVFHNGKTLTADDVVYSYRYYIDPKNKMQGASSLVFVKPENIRKIDDLTIELELNQPYSLLPSSLGERTLMIIPDGFTDWESPIGTGPFKFDNWTRGERSLFLKHTDYRDGLPYLDELEVISINDASARLNALVADEIDACVQVDPKLIQTVESDSNLALLEKPSGAYTCMYMQINEKPLDDIRVRQALRLAIDRQQIVDNALLGHGKVGNDLPCWFDPDYASDIEQRPYDPEQAKSLLKEAGQEGLTLTLQTSDAAPAMLDSSTLFAEQAKQAGITIKLKKWPADQYYGSAYLKQGLSFANTNWGGRPLIAQFDLGYTKVAPYNETVWKRDDFDSLLSQALASPDEAARRDLFGEAQRLLWEEGGYIIWGFLNNVDATSSKVKGIVPSAVRPLGYYDLRRTYIEV